MSTTDEDNTPVYKDVAIEHLQAAANAPHLDDIVAAAQAGPRQILQTDPEPPPGSILLVHSTTGTAAQRFYSDLLYHLTTGEVCSYDELFHRRGGARPVDVFVVYVPPTVEEQR